MNRYTASVTATIDGEPHTLSIEFEAEDNGRALDLGRHRVKYLRAQLTWLARTVELPVTRWSSAISIWSEHE